MKRNIICAISLRPNVVSFTIMEQLKTSKYIGLLNLEDNIENIDNFLYKSFSKARQYLGVKLNSIFVIIDPIKSTNSHILVEKFSTAIAAKYITSNDVNDNLLRLQNKITNSLTSENKIVNVQPIKYTVTEKLSGIEKDYLMAPLGRPGDKITICATITVISNNIYNKLADMAKKHNFSIKKILLSSQVIPQSIISSETMKKGNININIDEHQSEIIINKYNSTLKLDISPTLSLNGIIEKIAHKLLCNFNEAKISLFKYIDFESSDENKEEWNNNKEKITIIKEIVSVFVNELIEFFHNTTTKQEYNNIIYLTGTFSDIAFIYSTLRKKMNMHIIKRDLNSFEDKNLLYMRTRGADILLNKMNDSLGNIDKNNIIETNKNNIETIVYDKIKKPFWEKRRLLKLHERKN